MLLSCSGRRQHLITKIQIPMLSVISCQNISKCGNAIVQWIYLHFPSCGSRFKSQALITTPQLFALSCIIHIFLALICEENKSFQKEVHIFKNDNNSIVDTVASVTHLRQFLNGSLTVLHDHAGASFSNGYLNLANFPGNKLDVTILKDRTSHENTLCKRFEIDQHTWRKTVSEQPPTSSSSTLSVRC